MSDIVQMDHRDSRISVSTGREWATELLTVDRDPFVDVDVFG